MKTKNTALATAIALSLATGGLITSGTALADTSTRMLQSVIDRQPANDGFIYITAGETINLAMLGLNQDGIIDTLGEQYGAIIFAAVHTTKGEIFIGSDTPGERENNADPTGGKFDMAPPAEPKPFNNLKYVRLTQGLGRAYLYYPPNINTPPIVEKQEGDRQYDECCFLPCGEKIPADQLYCPDDDRQEAQDVPPVEETLTVTLQERFLNAAGGVEYKVIDTVDKKIKILPYLPKVKKLQIVEFEVVDGTKAGNRAAKNCALDGNDCNPSDGIRAKMKAGQRAKVKINAMREDPVKGFDRDWAANGRIVLQLIVVGTGNGTKDTRGLYMELPAMDMLNGEAIVTLPNNITKAGKYYLEATLTLAVNGAIDPSSDLALSTTVDSIDMLTADLLTVESTGKAKKLKLDSVKTVMSAAGQTTSTSAGNELARWNAADQLKVSVLDEYGNETALPTGVPTKVKVTDEAGVLNTATLNLDFAAGALKSASDWIGDADRDIIRTGEASLTAMIEGAVGIAASDPVKVKVVAQNLVARPYAGSLVAGDIGYGAPQVPAANGPYPQGGNPPYLPTKPDSALKDVQVGNSIKAFSVAVDGASKNPLPDGRFNEVNNPNVVDLLNDDFLGKNGASTVVVKTPAGEEVEAGVAQATWNVADAVNPNGTVNPIAQADGTVGAGARVEVVFTKPVAGKKDNGDPNYFIIGDKAGLYGQTMVYMPGDIKASAATQAKILNAHGFEPQLVGDDGKPVLDENGLPIVQLPSQINPDDDTYKVILPTQAKPGDTGGVSLEDGQGNATVPYSGSGAPLYELGTPSSTTPSTSNGQSALTYVDREGNELGNINTTATRSLRAIVEVCPTTAATATAAVDTTADDPVKANVFTYDSDEFAGTDRISLGFSGASAKPRTIEVTIPPKPKLTTIKTEVEQTTLPVNSVVAITIRSLDQNDFAIDSLRETTVTFSGSILPTATLWRLEDEELRGGNGGTWQPTKLLSSGDTVRPAGEMVAVVDDNNQPVYTQCPDGVNQVQAEEEKYPGGNQQVIILNVGNKAGEFTLTFNHPDLAEPEVVTFKAVEVYTPPEVCGSAKPDLCTTEEDCTGASGTWDAKTSKCAFTTPVPTTADACQAEGGIYAMNKCYLAVDAKGNPQPAVVAELKASSSMGEPSDANLYGGLLITSGDRKTDKFEGNSSVTLGDNVNVAGVIKVDDVDKGKRADLVVGALHICKDVKAGCPEYPMGASWYMMVQCSGTDFTTIPTCPSFGWQVKVWPSDQAGNPVFSLLEPLKTITLPGITGDGLDAYQAMDMYKGNFVYPADPDPMSIYFGYVVVEGDNAGKVVFNDSPITVKIKKDTTSGSGSTTSGTGKTDTTTTDTTTDKTDTTTDKTDTTTDTTTDKTDTTTDTTTDKTDTTTDTTTDKTDTTTGKTDTTTTKK